MPCLTVAGVVRLVAFGFVFITNLVSLKLLYKIIFKKPR